MDSPARSSSRSVAVHAHAYSHRYCLYGDPTVFGLAVRLFAMHVGHALTPNDSIYRFSESKVLYGIIIGLSVPACAIGCVCGIKAWIIKV